MLLINISILSSPLNYGVFKNYINLHGLANLIPTSSRKAFRLTHIKKMYIIY